MSLDVFAFIEIRGSSGWELFKGFAKEHHDPPFNLAPISWGKYNFSRYYEASGEKGFPDELSPQLKKILVAQQAEWGIDAINRPSWMSVAEVLTFYQSDQANQYAHFDIQLLKEIKKQGRVRVIFWSV